MIKITRENLGDDLKQTIYKELGNHARQQMGCNEISEVVAFVAKENDKFAGAVTIQPFWGALHIKLMVVKEEYRSQKIATQLMQQVFEYGKSSNYCFAFVETLSFQALGFYLKMGFKLEFTRPGYSHGVSFHYLRKDL